MNDSYKELKESMIQYIETYFEKHHDVKDKKVIQIADDQHIESFVHHPLSTDGRNIHDVIEELEKDILPYQLESRHPRHFGFIPGPSDPHAVFGEMIAGLHNIHASNWVNASGAYAIEKNLIRWAASQIGYNPDLAGGLFVSGGSMANLTALVAARDEKIPFEKTPQSCVYFADQTHHSVDKAIKIMGLSEKQMRIIKSNDEFQMIPEELEAQIQKDLENGFMPSIIIASAGTTNTGSVDKLDQIADIAEKHDIWLHVDGAYGASYILSDYEKHRFKGIDRADSVSWDGHKMLYQNYSSAMVLVKDKRFLFNSYSAKPEYLEDVELEGHDNFGSLGIELTRPVRALKMWVTFESLGLNEVKRRIEQASLNANYLHKLLNKDNYWQIISGPCLGIINFRYYNPSFTEDKLDNINHILSQRILKSGYAGLFTTELKGHTVLRAAVTNPFLSQEDLKGLMLRLNDELKTLL